MRKRIGWGQAGRKGDQLGSHAIVPGRGEGSQGKRSAGSKKTNMQYVWEENATELGDVLM